MDLKTFKLYSVDGMDSGSSRLLSPKKGAPMLKRQTSVVELIRQKSEGDQSLSYQQNFLSVIVVGASGDLAKKKTYPSLFQLYCRFTVPELQYMWVRQEDYSDATFREKMRNALKKKFKGPEFEEIESFISFAGTHAVVHTMMLRAGLA